MSLSSLYAVSPVDGRYYNTTKSLGAFFSEAGLIKYRVFVEIEYFIALCQIPLPQLADFDQSKFEALRDIYRNFQEGYILEVKEIEKTTNHDVKAVEYFIKNRFDELGLQKHKEFIHFGLTSQDVNNTSIPYSLKEGLEQVINPEIQALIDLLKSLANDWKNIPLLAHTHGQPASPTKLGKEILVFVERLEKQFEQLKAVPFSAKFGGATGNFNAHHVAYGNINWQDFGNKFVNEQLGLNRSQYTTQIEHYDNLAAIFDALKRICGHTFP